MRKHIIFLKEKLQSPYYIKSFDFIANFKQNLNCCPMRNLHKNTPFSYYIFRKSLNYYNRSYTFSNGILSFKTVDDGVLCKFKHDFTISKFNVNDRK